MTTIRVVVFMMATPCKRYAEVSRMVPVRQPHFLPIEARGMGKNYRGDRVYGTRLARVQPARQRLGVTGLFL